MELTNELTKKPESIITILEKLGCDKIKYNACKGYITSTRPEENADNPLGNMVYVRSLQVHQNTRLYKGNIYTLVMDVKGLDFPACLRLIATWIGYKSSGRTIKLPFHSFFRKFEKCLNDTVLTKVYDEEELPSADSLSYKYILDGVSAKTQEKFGVRYDHESDAIITPIYDCSGRLVGAKARRNNPNCEHNKRFFALLEYSKNAVVYGYHFNYQNIVEKKRLIIFEAEKSVMIAHDMGCYICLAVGGHYISDIQRKYILALNAERIYIAFDEGISEYELKQTAEQLKVKNLFMKNKVGYIYDAENKYLPLGSKYSPVDCGKEVFEKLLKECCVWTESEVGNVK